MMRIYRKWWALIILLPAALLAPMLGGFIYLRGAEFSDLVISHLPNALWIQRSLREWGQIPLWSNTILSGYPFAANPLSGLHYPPGWIALLFPQPFGLNLVMLLHLAAGGAGMYFFLRGEGQERLPAGLGGLAFEAMPKLWAHLGAGHVTLVYAVCWTPWLLLAECRSRGQVWRPAAVLGLIALADVRWAVLAGILWLFYALKIAYSDKRESLAARAVAWTMRMAAGGLLSILLAAALLVPLAEAAQLSTRAGLSAQDNLAYSLAPGQLLGLLAPAMGGTPEYTLYAGGVVLALALLGLGLAEARRRAGFWYGVGLAALVIALGAHLPGAALVASLPGFNLLRVPTRALFASGLALAAAAAWTLQSLLEKRSALRDLPRFNPLLLLAALAVLLLALAGIGWQITGKFPLRFAWGGLALLGGLIILLFRRSERIDNPLLGFLCVGWLLIDLCISNYLGLQFHAANEIFAQGSAAAAMIQAQAPDARVYSPSYSLPQQTAARDGLELADGVDPLQLSAYVGFMRAASGVFSSDYSVTLPAFVSGDPEVDNRSARPDARLLGLLNVGVVATEFPLDVDGLEEIGQAGKTILYRNTFVHPRAWVQPPDALPGSGDYLPAEVTWSPDRITVKAEGPGLLILSEIAYPGWYARLDGAPVPLSSAVIFRAVDLPAGAHLVEFDFRPISVFAGLGVSVTAWLGILVLWLRNRLRKA
jgi:hypothetical protein